ncbi:MAG: restriction endonuclease subunit S [Treponema sp.]|nr:restriction endonuclease subunit S [Treponema sp.]
MNEEVKGKKSPQLRFSGFDDEWEEKKLGNVSDRVIRKNENLESTLPLTISAQYGLVDQITFFNNQVASTTNLRNYLLVKNGEFAYNKSYSAGYPWGAVKRLDRYEKGVLSTLYIVFKPKNINSDYLLSYYDTDKWYKQVSEIAAEGARNHGLLNIAPNDFFQTTFYAPKSENEQQKIGTILSKIDSLIQAKTKKLESLKAVKKSLLQKCFPKEGEKVPEMRFAGFSGDWEEKKLGEIATKVIDKNFDLSVQEVFTNSAEFGVISQRDFFDHDIANTANIDGYYVIQNEDFVYNPRISVTAPVGPINRNNLGRKGIMSPLYTIFRTKNINTLYLEWYFKTECWHDFMYLNGDSGARFDRFSIKDIVFFEMPILFPASVAEQQKIGQFFSKYDSLISAQQKEIDKLKDIKKSLLQKMFI